MSKGIILLTGKSGSGKSAVARELEKRYGFKMLRSYTTRPPRENDDTHTFVSKEDFSKLTGIVAYTEYNGFQYCATEQQVEESDVYVIDPDGVAYMREIYSGDKTLYDVYIKSDKKTRYNRMLNRGDTEEQAKERISYDAVAFMGYKPRFTLKNNDGNLNKVVGALVDFTSRFCII